MSDEPIAPEGTPEPEGTPTPKLGEATAPEYKYEPEHFQSMMGTLPEELRTTPILANTKDFEGMASQLVNQEKLIGKNTIAEPQEDWTPEQWGELYGKLGRPEEATGYFGDEEGIKALNAEFKEKFGENAPDLNPEELSIWGETFHSEGLNTKQAKNLFDKYSEIRMKEITAAKEATDAAVAEGTGALRQEWGDNYNANIDLANQAFDKIAPDELKILVDGDPVLRNNPGFLKLMQNLGKEMANGTQKMGGNPVGFSAGTPAAAEAELATIEANHGELLRTPANSLSFADRAKRQEIINRQTELFNQKYAEKAE